jgi:hypothetical protein
MSEDAVDQAVRGYLREQGPEIGVGVACGLEQRSNLPSVDIGQRSLRWVKWGALGGVQFSQRSVIAQ